MAALVFALFTSVMLVQFAVDEQHNLQVHGIQDDHLIVCEAVGIDPSWYQIAGSGQNSLLRTIPPLNLGLGNQDVAPWTKPWPSSLPRVHGVAKESP